MDQPVATEPNLSRDLPPSGEVCFPFIPFRYGTSLGTGTYADRWGGRRPPQRSGVLRRRVSTFRRA
jgi:hypothetical protein